MKYHYAKHIALLTLSLALGACSKTNTSPSVVFDGYTGRDATAKLTSPNDPTDWTTDATWTSAETDIFAKYNLNFTPPQLSASVWQMSAFPNPVSVGKQTQLSGLLQQASLAIPASDLRIAYAMVDTNYTILNYGFADSINKQFGAIITYSASKYSSNTLYRMYYVIFNNQDMTVYYKGHGDIMLVP